MKQLEAITMEVDYMKIEAHRRLEWQEDLLNQALYNLKKMNSSLPNGFWKELQNICTQVDSARYIGRETINRLKGEAGV
jgi:glutamine synthetase type III